VSAAALYSDAIRERWRQPRFRGEVSDATATAEDVNPLCGDRVRMTVRVRDGAVEAVRFTGDSCAICAASADVTAELSQGRQATEAARLSSEDVLTVLGTDVKPTRMRCVTLPISVLQQALKP
jgi:nitrogen fixation NifU-like protein